LPDSSLRPVTIEKLGMAVFPSLAMLAGMELDVFTPLGNGPLRAAEIADALDVNREKIGPLLYALVVAGLLRQEGDRFANSREADHFLVRGRPSYLGGRGSFYRARWSEALQTAASIRTGLPQAKIDFTAMSPNERESFYKGLHGGAMQAGRDLVKIHDFTSCQLLLDVGGGSGGLALAITQAHPHLRAAVVDLPSVTPVAQRFVEAAGAQGRVEVIAADPVQEPLTLPCDVAIMRAFLQVLSREAAAQALRNVAAAVKPGGVVFILGMGILDDSRVSPAEVVSFNLVFVNIYDQGQAYTESEHRQWLAEAGFGKFERIGVGSGTSVIKATRSA